MLWSIVFIFWQDFLCLHWVSISVIASFFHREKCWSEIAAVSGHVIHLTWKLSKILVLQCSLSSDSFFRIISKEFEKKIFQVVRTSVRKKFFNSDTLFWRKVDFHMGSLRSKAIKNLWFGRSNNIMNSIDLIKFIFSRKQWFLCDKLEQNTPETPDVHFFIIVPISHEAFRSTIPPCGDIVSKRCRTVLTFAWTQISKFYYIAFN